MLMNSAAELHTTNVTRDIDEPFSERVVASFELDDDYHSLEVQEAHFRDSANRSIGLTDFMYRLVGTRSAYPCQVVALAVFIAFIGAMSLWLTFSSFHSPGKTPIYPNASTTTSAQATTSTWAQTTTTTVAHTTTTASIQTTTSSIENGFLAAWSNIGDPLPVGCNSEHHPLKVFSWTRISALAARLEVLIDQACADPRYTCSGFKVEKVWQVQNVNHVLYLTKLNFADIVGDQFKLGDSFRIWGYFTGAPRTSFPAEIDTLDLSHPVQDGLNSAMFDSRDVHDRGRCAARTASLDRHLELPRTVRVRIYIGLDGRSMDRNVDGSITLGELKKSCKLNGVDFIRQSFDERRLADFAGSGPVVDFRLLKKRHASGHILQVPPEFDEDRKGMLRDGRGEAVRLGDTSGEVRPGDVVHFPELMGGSGDGEGLWFAVPGGEEAFMPLAFGDNERVEIPKVLNETCGGLLDYFEVLDDLLGCDGSWDWELEQQRAADAGRFTMISYRRQVQEVHYGRVLASLLPV